MIVIETCPKCGGNLETLVIATYPPIPKKMCMNCGWYWVGKVEEINYIWNDYVNEKYEKEKEETYKWTIAT